MLKAPFKAITMDLEANNNVLKSQNTTSFQYYRLKHNSTFQ